MAPLEGVAPSTSVEVLALNLPRWILAQAARLAVEERVGGAVAHQVEPKPGRERPPNPTSISDRLKVIRASEHPIDRWDLGGLKDEGPDEPVGRDNPVGAPCDEEHGAFQRADPSRGRLNGRGADDSGVSPGVERATPP